MTFMATYLDQILKTHQHQLVFWNKNKFNAQIILQV